MKKNLLTIIILALLIVNIALTSVMMFSVMGANKKTTELVNNIATVMQLELTTPGEEESAPEISLADTTVYNMDGSLTIPLSAEYDADGKIVKEGYIMFDVALSMNTTHEDYKTYGESILAGERDSLIKDAINSVITKHTASECRDFEMLKTEILNAVQELFQSDFIYKIAISDVKFG